MVPYVFSCKEGATSDPIIMTTESDSLYSGLRGGVVKKSRVAVH